MLSKQSTVLTFLMPFLLVSLHAAESAWIRQTIQNNSDNVASAGADTVSEKVIDIDSIFYSSSFRERKIVDFLHVGTKIIPDKYLYEIRKDGFYRYMPSMSLSQKKVDEQLLVSADRVKSCTKIAWRQPKEYILSSDKTKVVFMFDIERIYRFSIRYYAVLWDMEKDSGFVLGSGISTGIRGKITVNNNITGYSEEKISNVKFSPDNKKVSYIFNNNLYYYDLDEEKHVAVTLNGKKEGMINGRFDWVYEEEFQYGNRDYNAYIWSPNSTSIAFLSFDESNVREVFTEIWGGIYTSINSYKYPKAGFAASKVSVNLYNLNDTLIFPIIFRKNDNVEYVFNFEWSNNPDEFLVYTLNREQTDFKVYAVAVPSSFSRLIYSEKEADYSVTYNKKLIFLNDSQQHYFVISDRSGYNHIYLYNTDGTPLKVIEGGRHNVEKIYGIDGKRKRIYYQASYSKPYNREIFWVDFSGDTQKLVAPEIQERGGWNDAYFNEDFTEMLLIHSTINTPSTYYYYTISDTGEFLINVVEDNDRLKQTQAEYGFVDVNISTLKIRGNDSLYYFIMKPRELEKGKKYPLLVYTYGGPAIQSVRNGYPTIEESAYLWSQYLVSKGYIVACIDKRGSPGRSRDFAKCTYKRLGQLEMEDEFAAARFWASLPYIDSSRIGIWGWSYGGYLASLCLFNDSTPFKLAMAMAPISDWRFYDNIYAEHYMGFPQTNEDGYNRASLLNKTSKLKGKYFLAHGTNDDNVHFQHTMELVASLQKEGKFFDLLVFPNQNHYLRGGNSEELLYRKMTDFLIKNL